jgi:hypothetical protein
VDFYFELATPEDDPAIRRLLAASAMPGRITLAFEREPDYFMGCGTMGRFWQVLIARRRPGGEITGMLCRASRPHFINGQVAELGYIGQIRIAEKFRGLWLLSRGLAFFRELHADGRVAVYWGVISDDNPVARGVLVEHPRRQFPIAREVARICTLGIILQRPKAPLSSPYEIGRGSPEELGAIVAFLRRRGAAKQFFPAYAEDDFLDSPAIRGFKVQDFVVARQRGEIVGVVGLWDQSGYKQTVVKSYHDYLRWLRPFYNLGARLAGARPLPAPGEHIHSAYASFICTADNDPNIFRVLLRRVYNLAAERGYAHLMVGLVDSDPLLPVAREYPHITYYSRLYIGYWEKEAGGFYERLDGRIPYIEIAAL